MRYLGTVRKARVPRPARACLRVCERPSSSHDHGAFDQAYTGTTGPARAEGCSAGQSCRDRQPGRRARCRQQSPGAAERREQLAWLPPPTRGDSCPLGLTVKSHIMEALRWALIGFFATHIPITLLVDAQALLPAQLYPESARSLGATLPAAPRHPPPSPLSVHWYAHEFSDPFMSRPPIWFKSFILCELLIQVPPPPPRTPPMPTMQTASALCLLCVWTLPPRRQHPHPGHRVLGPRVHHRGAAAGRGAPHATVGAMRRPPRVRSSGSQMAQRAAGASRAAQRPPRDPCSSCCRPFPQTASGRAALMAFYLPCHTRPARAPPIQAHPHPTPDLLLVGGAPCPAAPHRLPLTHPCEQPLALGVWAAACPVMFAPRDKQE